MSPREEVSPLPRRGTIVNRLDEIDGLLIMLALIVLLTERVLVSGVGGRLRDQRIRVLDAVLVPMSCLCLLVLAARFIGSVLPS